MEQIRTLPPHKQYVKKFIAIPFTIFTEFLLHMNNVCTYVGTGTGYGLFACASMDGCVYVFHLYFLYFNVITPCETLMLLCLKVLVLICSSDQLTS